MNRTSALSYPDFARFLVNNLDAPTEGSILDALRQHGASDREVEISMGVVRNQLENPVIDIDSPDMASIEDAPLAEGEGATLDELIDTPAETGPGMGLDGIPAEPPGAIDDPLAPTAEGFEVQDLSTEDVDSLAEDFQVVNPEATPEDMEEYLQGIVGLPEEEARRVRVTKVAAVPVQDAVNYLLEQNPNLETDSIRVKLEEFGIPEREVEEVVRRLPPTQQEGPAKDWYSEAEQLQNTGQSQEEIMAFLEGEGASPEDINSVRNSLGTGSRVGTAKVSKVWDSEIFDTSYELDNGEIVSFNEAVTRIASAKEADTRDPIDREIDDFNEEEWDETSASATKDRIDKADAVLAKVHDQLTKHATVELDGKYQALREERQILANRISLGDYPDSQEYLDDLPKYSAEVADRSLPIGHEVSASWHETVFEAEDAIASIDWNRQVTAGADEYVEDIGGEIIGDAGEVRKIASRYIRSLTSHLSAEDSEPIERAFLSNVERSRRAAAKVVVSKKSSVDDLPEGDILDEGVFL